MATAPKDQDKLTEAEAAKRRDAVLRKMLNTPPQHRTVKNVAPKRQKANAAAKKKRRIKPA